jgi:uncharacterized integral membrane protein (TIGR00698 family)
MIGRRWLKLDANTVILIGAGSSICGAAAILATEPVVNGKPDQVSVAVSTVLVFGSFSMLIYPFLFHWNLMLHFLPVSKSAFGLFTGSTVHEVAQVVAAARPLGDVATNAAVITKMVRVMMLAPFLVLLTLQIKCNDYKDSEANIHNAAVKVPWFVMLFIAMIGLNSLNIIPQTIVSSINKLDTLLLATAMTALGLSTNFMDIKKAGHKPLVLGLILFIWLILGGGLINKLVNF